MKSKTIVIGLLLVISIQALTLQQLYKLPVLVLHYFEHQQHDQSVTVMEYLSMHYWGQDLNDNDQARDMQLPFKKADVSHSVTMLFFQHDQLLVDAPHAVDQSYPLPTGDRHLSAHLQSLFKPPRLA